MALLCAAGLAFGVATPPSVAEDSIGLERRVKAAYLYKFAAYVEWPSPAVSTPDAPFTIAIVGDDELATDVERVCIDRTINGHRIVVRRLDPGASIDGAQIVFIGRNQADRLEHILATAPIAPCLVVTETDGALTRGSIINFVLVDAHVRFEISQAAAGVRGLNLSSRLLAVAVSVVPAVP
jgi:hypothetical protein